MGEANQEQTAAAQVQRRSAPADRETAGAAMPIAAAVQLNSVADRDRNLEKALVLLKEAALAGANIAFLPENFAYMGKHDADKLAIAELDGDGPIQNFLAQTARELGLWIVAGTVPIVVLDDPGRVWPACIVYDAEGERVAHYDKIHLFDVEVPGGERYQESQTMKAGELTPVVVETPVGVVGLSICYDVRFPELYRALVSLGADVLSIPAAFTEGTGRAHWETLLRARAIENQCYVIAAAEEGTHASGRRTWGHSTIINPWGEVLGMLGSGEGIVTAPIDLPLVASTRARFPALSHRRFL